MTLQAIAPGALSLFFAQADGYYQKPVRHGFFPENLFTFSFGNLPRWVQNLIDSISDASAHGAEDESLSDASISICGTMHAREAARFRSYKRRKKRKRRTYEDILREEAEREEALNDIHRTIENLGRQITNLHDIIQAVGAPDYLSAEQSSLDEQIYKIDIYRRRIAEEKIQTRADVAYLREKLLRRARALRSVKSRLIGHVARLWPECEYDLNPKEPE